MKTKILLLILTLVTLVLSAQVAVNNDNSEPDGSAMLDVKSTTKGMLTPRMDSAQRATIINPATGLLVYQVNGKAGFYYFNGTIWEYLSPVTYQDITGTDDKVMAHNDSTWVAQTLSIDSTGSGSAINNIQPVQVLNYLINVDGIYPYDTTDTIVEPPFLAQVVLFGGHREPNGWKFCHGQLLQITSYQYLFSILGTTYGGDGRTTFGLPDLRGRAPIGAGSGPGLTNAILGAKKGTENNNLSVNQLAKHNHEAKLEE